MVFIQEQHGRKKKQTRCQGSADDKAEANNSSRAARRLCRDRDWLSGINTWKLKYQLALHLRGKYHYPITTKAGGNTRSSSGIIKLSQWEYNASSSLSRWHFSAICEAIPVFATSKAWFMPPCLTYASALNTTEHGVAFKASPWKWSHETAAGFPLQFFAR